MNKPLTQDGSKPKATAEGQFQWQDPLLLSAQLSEDERLISQAARTFCQERLQPVVRDMHRHESFDPALMNEFGEMGFLGCSIHEHYGWA